MSVTLFTTCLGNLNPNLCLTHIRALWLDSAFSVIFGQADLTPSMSRAALVTGAQLHSDQAASRHWRPKAFMPDVNN